MFGIFRKMLPQPTNGADREEKREWLGDLVRITILIWSAGLLTASYVRLPGGQKVMDFDPTFIASVFSGSLAGFGVAVASKGGMSSSQSTPIPAEISRTTSAAKKEEDKTEEPVVAPVWTVDPPVDPPADDPLEQLRIAVEALEKTAESQTTEEDPEKPSWRD